VREGWYSYPVAVLDKTTRVAFGSGDIFPMLFLVDVEGKISRLVLNYQDLDTLEGLISEMIGIARE
jgi:hypothetical protein